MLSEGEGPDPTGSTGGTPLAGVQGMSHLNLQAFEVLTLHPWLSAAPVSVVLQFVALVRLRGVLQSVSLILTAITLAACALAVAAYMFDPGNLWSLLLQLAGPPVLVLTAGILVMGLLLGRPDPIARVR